MDGDQDQEDPWHHHQHYPSCTHCWPQPHHYRYYDRFISTSHVITTTSSDQSKDDPVPLWTLLWKKLKSCNKNKNTKKKKKTRKGSMKILQCCYCCDADPVSMNFGYDSISYLQNFDDHGHYYYDYDRDDLGRSFSARFAVPSSIFDHKN